MLRAGDVFYIAPGHDGHATDLQQFELAFFKRTGFVWLLKSFQNDFKHESLLQFLGKCGGLAQFHQSVPELRGATATERLSRAFNFVIRFALLIEA